MNSWNEIRGSGVTNRYVELGDRVSEPIRRIRGLGVMNRHVELGAQSVTFRHIVLGDRSVTFLHQDSMMRIGVSRTAREE